MKTTTSTSCSISAVLAKTIREMRIRSNLTQNQLAVMCGISRMTVYLIEGGRQIPSLKTMILIAESLDLSLDWLMFQIRKKKNGKGKKQHGSKTFSARNHHVGAES